MSYWFNRAKLLKNARDITIKEENRSLLNIMLLIKKSSEKMQEISIEVC